MPAAFSPDAVYDLFVSLETLEHIEPAALDAYLRRVSESLASGGRLLISVPNETGIIFVLKQLNKKVLLEGARKYSAREFLWQTFGRVENVARDEHKGFSWRRLKSHLEYYFVVDRVEGLQIPVLGPSLNASVGLVLHKP